MPSFLNEIIKRFASIQKRAGENNITLDLSSLKVADYTRAGDEKAKATELLKTLSGTAEYFEKLQFPDVKDPDFQDTLANVHKGAKYLQEYCKKALKFFDQYLSIERSELYTRRL